MLFQYTSQKALSCEVESISLRPAGLNELAYLARLKASASTPARNVLLRMFGGRPERSELDFAISALVSSRTSVPVPATLAHGTSPIPYTISASSHNQPLSNVWHSLPAAVRQSLLKQLVSFAAELRSISFPSIGSLTLTPAGVVDFKPDEFSARGVAVAAAGGASVAVAPVVAYYQRCLDQKYVALSDMKLSDLAAYTVSKITQYAERDVPSLCATYSGTFVLGLPQLRLSDIIIDPTDFRIVAVSGWNRAKVVTEEDTLAAIQNFADTPEETEFVTAAATAAGFPALPDADKRTAVRRIIGLCDRIIEHRTWAVYPGPAADDILREAIAMLKSKFPVGAAFGSK